MTNIILIDKTHTEVKASIFLGSAAALVKSKDKTVAVPSQILR